MTAGNDQTIARPPSTETSEPERDETEAPKILVNRYVLLERLGAGGMGIVYKALDRDVIDGKRVGPVHVALKIINREKHGGAEAIEAIKHEGIWASRLRHKNIIEMYSVERDGDMWFLTMELLEGESFESIIARYPDGVPVAEAVPLMAQLLDGIEFAHTEQKIVHSDLKPSNLFVTRERIVKIFDFGISSRVRAIGDPETRFDARRWGALSPSYACLEMWSGVSADPRDDVYSAACIAYQLLCGKHPYGGFTALQVFETNRRFEPIAALSRRRNAALKHALSLHRESRTASAAQFRAEFAESAASSIWRWTIAAIAVMAVIGLAALAYVSRTARQTAAAPPIPAGSASIRMPAAAPPAPAASRAPGEVPTNSALPGPAARPGRGPAMLLRYLGISAIDQGDKNPGRPEDLRELVETAPRSVALGSTPKQILLAFELCRKFSADCQPDWYDDEKIRQVKLTPFALDPTPVTVGDFRKFVARTHYLTGPERRGGVAFAVVDGHLKPVPGGSWRNAVTRDGPAPDDLAVVGVDFTDAQAYCRFLDERLPSEAEWEYAARGPSGDVYPALEGGGAPAVGELQPPAASGPPEGIGGRYRGLSGGVWEWVDSAAAGRKVLKGGSWLEKNPANRRAAAHRFEEPDRADADSGFRCARSTAKWPDADLWLAGNGE